MDNLEEKLKSIAKERGAESAEDGPKENAFHKSDVVAVFVPDWNKYVRVCIKEKERDDLYCVWAIDYGVPMVVQASEIVKLPLSFKGMHLNKQKDLRVHAGGIDNCLPGEKQFNFAEMNTTQQKLLKWTPSVIGLMQKILYHAVKLEFENVRDLAPLKKPHYFGRLMVQRSSDGKMINLMETLLELNMAILAEHDFKSKLTSIESISQATFLSVNNELLNVTMCVVPFKTVSEADTDDETKPIKLETSGE